VRWFFSLIIHCLPRLTSVKWLGPGAINPLVVDGKGGKAELIPAVRRWVNAHGRNVTLPGKRMLPVSIGAKADGCSHDRFLRDTEDIAGGIGELSDRPAPSR
jgi:hypothetical protein